MTEKEKMLAGKIYDPASQELLSLRQNAHRLCKLYNDTFEEDVETREKIIAELIPSMGSGGYLQGPIYFDYGIFTKLGKNFYANFNLTVLDVCPVTIGDNVFVGPNVSILTPKHPLRYQDRNIYKGDDGRMTNKECGSPITIGDNCWIAGNVTILAGAVIGSGCVIGAGSVVAGNIPDNSLAYGNPCKVVRKITEADALMYKKELLS
ncbi:MAG: sugar O-acetyltransferase [Clostridiales bacterium]|nr:sugar O-acetyltransferase [Clostridiales bacterium]